ncbi:MAG: methyltransferase domain-containing protein [Verrucomicrobiota bacterium]
MTFHFLSISNFGTLNTEAPNPRLDLVRIAETFSHWLPDIFQTLGMNSTKRLGKEYHLVSGGRSADSPAALACIRWRIPIHHSWPCKPRETEQFIERAAQALAAKFVSAKPQTILCGALDPGDAGGYYRKLASNLRGRVLQVFPGYAGMPSADDQDPERSTLFCMVGKEGLYAGLASPREANGFHPGGTRFIKQNAPETISRAGAKISEALHFFALYGPLPPGGAHWLELGASPGGMTAELLARGYRVTAVDRAPLDVRLHGQPMLRFHLADAAKFPNPARPYDAILSDLNGVPQDSLRLVLSRVPHLRPGGIVVFTVKLAAISSLADLSVLENVLLAMAEKSGLTRIARTHLTYNRNEFTWFFRK